jgi:hypothetical protein
MLYHVSLEEHTREAIAKEQEELEAMEAQYSA